MSGAVILNWVLGAIIGGVIGNNVAGDQSDGTVGGAILGGVAGAAIARNANRCDEPVQGSAPPPDEQGYDEPYDDSQGLEGAPDERYGSSDDCRWGTMTYYDDRGRLGHDASGIAADRFGLVLHPRHEIGHHASVRAQGRAARQAIDQAKIERTLERSNTPSDGCMVHAELAGGGRKRAGPRQGGKMKKVLPIDHRCIIAQLW